MIADPTMIGAHARPAVSGATMAIILKREDAERRPFPPKMMGSETKAARGAKRK